MTKIVKIPEIPVPSNWREGCVKFVSLIVGITITLMVQDQINYKNIDFLKNIKEAPASKRVVVKSRPAAISPPKPVTVEKVSPKTAVKEIVKAPPVDKVSRIEVPDAPMLPTQGNIVINSENLLEVKNLFAKPPDQLPEIAPTSTDTAIPEDGLPPLPEENAVDQSIYADTPGQRVVVFGVFVNEDGKVVDVTIIIPSQYALADLSIATAVRGQKWSNIVPPVLPGEIRKLEIRYEYAAESTTDTPSNVVP